MHRHSYFTSQKKHAPTRWSLEGSTSNRKALQVSLLPPPPASVLLSPMWTQALLATPLGWLSLGIHSLYDIPALSPGPAEMEAPIVLSSLTETELSPPHHHYLSLPDMGELPACGLCTRRAPAAPQGVRPRSTKAMTIHKTKPHRTTTSSPLLVRPLRDKALGPRPPRLRARSAATAAPGRPSRPG